MSEKAFEEWAILELFGHRKLAGLIKEETIGSATFIRIDVIGIDGKFTAIQFYNPAAVYCITPTSEESARRAASINDPQPVKRWELLPEPQASVEEPEYEEDEELPL